jgi:hypothetical protein
MKESTTTRQTARENSKPMKDLWNITNDGITKLAIQKVARQTGLTHKELMGGPVFRRTCAEVEVIERGTGQRHDVTVYGDEFLTDREDLPEKDR